MKTWSEIKQSELTPERTEQVAERTRAELTRIAAIERFNEARKALWKVAPDTMQHDAIAGLRDTVYQWRDGDDPRKLIGAAMFIIEAFDMEQDAWNAAIDAAYDAAVAQSALHAIRDAILALKKTTTR